MTAGEVSRSVVRRWLLAWLGGTVIGVANGVAREVTYGKRVYEQTAHKLSALTGIGAFAGYFSALQRRWPIPSTSDAFRIGACWLLLTVAFEFTFGRLVAEKSWEDLVADYNVREGRTWPAVLAWIAVGPAVVRHLSERRYGGGPKDVFVAKLAFGDGDRGDQGHHGDRGAPRNGRAPLSLRGSGPRAREDLGREPR